MCKAGSAPQHIDETQKYDKDKQVFTKTLDRVKACNPCNDAGHYHAHNKKDNSLPDSYTSQFLIVIHE